MAPSRPHPMKAYASFDAFLADQSEPNQKILLALRRLVRRETTGLEETVKWGQGCWVRGKEPVAFAHCEPDHVQFGFFAGAKLEDAEGLLEGKGRFVRHVKVRAAKEASNPGVVALLREAAGR